MKNMIRVFLFFIFISSNAYISALERALEENETLITPSMTNVEIQNKIDTAVEDEIILFDVGTYDLNLKIIKGITLKGISTAHVVLTNSGTSSIVSINNANNVTIQNITFDDAAIGIFASGSSSATIINNIFTVGDTSVGIQIDEFSEFEIRNNTFSDIEIAIEILNRDKTHIVKNNIFSNFPNSDFLFVKLFNESVTYSCFDVSVPFYSDSGFNKLENDILFSGGDKATEKNQFQLKSDSPCIDIAEGSFDLDGTQTDAGAYGGKEADQFPFPAEDVKVTKVTSSSVTVSWLENEDYRVEGYKIYYDKQRLQGRETLIDRSTLSTIKIEDTTQVSASVDNLDTSLDLFPTPDAPELTNVEPRSKKLLVNWNKVSDATAYRIYYRTGDNGEVLTKDVADVDNAEITGLNDGESYTVWIRAIGQFQYFFQVVAYLKADEDEIEGLFINTDIPYVIGTKESDISTTKSVIPEAVEAYPKLPNEGCFIATAAFGYYSHHQVQILRDFRDKYLLTNEFGTGFVTWYYQYGPTAAAFINKYESFKPVVRVLLYPLIITVQILAYDLALFWLVLFAYFMIFVFIIKRLTNIHTCQKRLNGVKSC